MPKFSRHSTRKLATCHPDLVRLFQEIIKHFDCTILAGYRGEREQEQLYLAGNSKLRYPKSKHNRIPSMAVDAIPYYNKPPHVRWDDQKRIFYFGGFVTGTAATLGIPLRWGGDWDRDTIPGGGFEDLVHFELEGPMKIPIDKALSLVQRLLDWIERRKAEAPDRRWKRDKEELLRALETGDIGTVNKLLSRMLDDLHENGNTTSSSG